MSIFTIFCRFFVAIYALFPQFFLAKIAFTATSHVFCMYDNSSIFIVLVCVLPDFRSSSILFSPFASTLHCISFNSSAALNEGRFALFDLYFTSVMRHCSLVSHLSPVFCQQTFNGQMCSICYVSAIMNVDHSSNCNIGF